MSDKLEQTSRLEELCEIISSYLTPNDHNRSTIQPFMKSILLEFAMTIKMEAVDVSKNT